MASQETPVIIRKKDKWWQLLLWSAACFGVAAYLYWDLSNFEESGGTRRMRGVVGLIYNLLGKWGCVGLFALGGVFLGGLGVKEGIAGKKA